MNYCCAKCGALVKDQDLKKDVDPRTEDKRWLCKDCKKKVDELRKRAEEAENDVK